MAELLLKWGTIKGWENIDGECLDLLKKYFEGGMSMSCAMDRPDDKRKKILCNLIDKFTGKIQNDWTGKYMTKEEAKKYVMEYGEKDAA